MYEKFLKAGEDLLISILTDILKDILKEYWEKKSDPEKRTLDDKLRCEVTEKLAEKHSSLLLSGEFIGLLNSLHFKSIIKEYIYYTINSENCGSSLLRIKKSGSLNEEDVIEHLTDYAFNQYDESICCIPPRPQMRHFFEDFFRILSYVMTPDMESEGGRAAFSVNNTVRNTIREEVSSLKDEKSSYIWARNRRVSSPARNRFRFDSESVGLFGREPEMSLLEQFCEDAAYQLCWTGICGKGGSGKSRLAYEICREMERKGWKIYWPSHIKANIERIKNDLKDGIHKNILICFDYVKFALEEFESLIYQLVETPCEYENKVRMILVERDSSDLEIDVDDVNEYKYEYDKNADRYVNKSGFMELVPIEDEMLVRAMQDYILKQKSDRHFDGDEGRKLMEVLVSIDLDKRPLYALFIADAWCNGEDLRHWDKKAALEYVVSRERNRFEKVIKEEVQIKSEQKVFKESLFYVVAVSTFLNGISLDEVAGLMEKLFHIDVKEGRFQWILTEAGVLYAKEEKLTGIEPDLVGEYYCITVLNKLSRENVRRFFQYVFSAVKFSEAVSYAEKIYVDYTESVEEAEWADDFRKISWPEGLTFVPYKQFKECKYLKEVYLHDHIFEIRAGAFQNSENLERIVFPSLLESIGKNAFAGCENLTEIVAKDGMGLKNLTLIEENAFRGCSSLSGFEIPESVRTIKHSTFAGCSSLRRIEFSSRINTIESNAFGGCRKIETIIFDSYSERIVLCDYAFRGCESLRVIKGIEKISEIGNGVFEKCTNLVKLTFTGCLRKIGNRAFRDCTKLEQVSLATCRIRELSEQIFYNCKSLKNIILPKKLECIGNEAFYNCIKLKKMVIPSNVKRIDHAAFKNCVQLSSLSLPTVVQRTGAEVIMNCRKLSIHSIGNIPAGEVEFGGFIFSSISHVEIDFLTSYAKRRNVEIPKTVLKIGRGAFAYQNNLIKIKIPDSVVKIEENAFCGCCALTEIDAEGNHIEEIGKRAFEGCTALGNFRGTLNIRAVREKTFYKCAALKELTITEKLEKIGRLAFADCENLERISFKNEELDIGVNAFLHCGRLDFSSKIKSLYCEGANIKIYGFLFEKLGEEELDFLNCYWEQEDVYIPESCAGFSDFPFRGNKSIKTIYVPAGLCELIPRLFAGCECLEEVVFENGIKNIPQEFFIGCRCLQRVTLPQEVEEIGENVFRACRNLRMISLPETLINIGAHAFEGCTQLHTVKGLENTQVKHLNESTFRRCVKLENIKVPDYLESIGNSCFRECHSLKNIKMPNTINEIGKAAFQDCYQMSEINFPEGIVRIQSSSFKCCRSLNHVDLSNKNVVSIGAFAFYGCHNMQTFDFPPDLSEVGQNAFENCRQIKRVKIPSGIESLSSAMFKGCLSLKKVDIPKHVTCIPANCFKDCINLEKIIIPDAIRKVGTGAFRNCTLLKKMDFPESLEKIGISAFKACSSLTKIELPASVKDIPDFAFEDCYKLKTVTWGEINRVGWRAFCGCKSLESIPMESITEYIGIAAFSKCTSLTEAVFSDRLSEIDKEAFIGCTAIKKITVSDSVVIGIGAFDECPAKRN